MKTITRTAIIKFVIVFSLILIIIPVAHTYKITRKSAPEEIDITSIPDKIGQWYVISQDTDLNTQESKFLDRILKRTYKDKEDRIIWLVVAYAPDQRQNFSLHIPEGCYRFAGFDVTSGGLFNIDIGERDLNAKRLITRGDGRIEPMHYWIVLDGKVVTNHFERKIKQIFYSFKATPTQGTIVRVSSPASERDITMAYQLQTSFIKELYLNIDPELRRYVFGT